MSAPQSVQCFGLEEALMYQGLVEHSLGPPIPFIMFAIIFAYCILGYLALVLKKHLPHFRRVARHHCLRQWFVDVRGRVSCSFGYFECVLEIRVPLHRLPSLRLPRNDGKPVSKYHLELRQTSHGLPVHVSK